VLELAPPTTNLIESLERDGFVISPAQKPLSYIPSSCYVPMGSLKPLESRNPRRLAAAPLWRCPVRTNFLNDRVICSVDRGRG
jgi:hypothetical protein